MIKSPVPYYSDAQFNNLGQTERMLMFARSQVGVQEIPRGSNWGPVIRLYLKAAGFTTPQPWCGCFLIWCAWSAHHELKYILSASTVQMYARAKKAGRLSRLPKRGRIFVYHDGKVGHCGIIIKVVGAKIWTIEGNTNDEGSREGYEVCVRVRNHAEIKDHPYWGFIDMEVRGK
jgi:hypothetical protein